MSAIHPGRASHSLTPSPSMSATVSNMVHNDETAGSNPFWSSHNLIVEEADSVRSYAILVPPDHMPPKEWHISHGGIVVLLVPTDAALRQQIFQRQEDITPAERAYPLATTTPRGVAHMFRAVEGRHHHV